MSYRGVLNIAFPESELRRGRVIANGTICPTLDTGCEVGVVMASKVKQIGNLIDDTDKVFKNPQRGRVYDPDGICPTLNTMQGGQLEPKITETTPNGERIRKLMPIECFRLQGWTDDYFRKAEQMNTDSQLYKQCGNAVTVNVIKAIAERL